MTKYFTHITAFVLVGAIFYALLFGAQPAGTGIAYTITLQGTHGYTIEAVPESTSVTATVHIDTIGPNTFLQLYNANIGSDNEYFGVQSTTGKWTVIWSVFNFASSTRVRTYGKATDAFGVHTVGDGTYTSVRLLVKPAHNFVLTIAAAGDGWWTFSVDGNKVGAIKVGKGTLQTTGSAWAEYWQNDYAAHKVAPPAFAASVTLQP